MKTVILFRGLPGSGKTTIANLVCDAVFSADDFFTDKKGVYKFNFIDLDLAHASCLRRFKAALTKGVA